jgi:hypothetical protein
MQAGRNRCSEAIAMAGYTPIESSLIAHADAI